MFKQEYEQLLLLVKDHILPRLTDLEEEVRLLRKVTWPVCQRQIETSPLSDTESKREFFRHLSDEETLELLRLKSRLPNSLVLTEFDRIRGVA